MNPFEIKPDMKSGLFVDWEKFWVAPYNKNTNDGNGFTFDRYDAGLLLDAINRAKTLYFNNRWCWDEMVQRDMAKDVSWENSAKQYKDLYVDVTK